MDQIYSVCTFVRKQFNLKGKTFHTGRGAFHMDIDVCFETVKERVEKKLEKLKPLLESYEITDTKIVLVFKQECVRNRFYRTFIYSKQEKGLGLTGEYEKNYVGCVSYSVVK